MNYISRVIIQQLTRRNHSRWSGRSPLGIVMPDEYDENERKYAETDKKVPLVSDMNIKWRFKADEANQEDVSNVVSQPETKLPKAKPPRAAKKKVHSIDMLETVIDADGKFIYTKMKNNDARVGKLLTNIKSKKSATKHDLVLLEGRRLVQDALFAGCILKYLLFSRKQDVELIKSSLPNSGAKIYKMPLKEMQMWSDLTTCPGIMGLFRTPDTENYIGEAPALPLTIYCDSIREPGNLGAILRVAAAVSCRCIKLSEGCTYLWDSKVIRSAAGAHFRMQIEPKQNVDMLREILSNPNVPTKLFIADNNTVHDLSRNNKAEDCESIVDLVNQIPVVPYYAIDLKGGQNTNTEIIFVIGGETTGLSADVYQLAKEYNGVRLNIPMNNGIDSLNSATAFGIIAFEMYKEYITKL